MLYLKKFGYVKKDARKLAKIYRKQGGKNYVSNNYTKGVLDQYGQRITIVIDLSGTTIKLGWMITQYGNRLITPFAGLM